jgi:hypothetical protein
MAIVRRLCVCLRLHLSKRGTAKAELTGAINFSDIVPVTVLLSTLQLSRYALLYMLYVCRGAVRVFSFARFNSRSIAYPLCFVKRFSSGIFAGSEISSRGSFVPSSGGSEPKKESTRLCNLNSGWEMLREMDDLRGATLT